MAGQAQVTSVEALEAFRADLILFLSRARPALEEIGAEVVRTRIWLEDDRQRHWEWELRRRRKALEQAQQELFSARVSSLDKATATHQLAVRRAQQSVDEAEEKCRVLKQWNREFDDRTAPMIKQVDQLHSFLATHLRQAIAELTETVKALEAYTQVAPPSESGGPALPGTALPEDAAEDTRDPEKSP